ncbi:MAG: hypothetical protein P1P69_01920 [Methanosarcinaceae archaeon]|nr:hypothetical protein [Methanosarcinaceae archaeon]MDF1533245.1 hypothetical protein [Methanosarcinaceae archaeon]
MRDILQPIKQNVGRTELILEQKQIGNDHVITLTGGEGHVGAVAVGVFDEKNGSASASVITSPGHREEGIALENALRISEVTKTATVFIVGIHLDNITKDEIDKIIVASRQMTDKFINSL